MRRRSAKKEARRAIEQAEQESGDYHELSPAQVFLPPRSSEPSQAEPVPDYPRAPYTDPDNGGADPRGKFVYENPDEGRSSKQMKGVPSAYAIA